MAVIDIIPFHPVHQPRIDKLMQHIQDEFAEKISGPTLTKMSDAALLPGRKYWVALAEDDVAGTVGIIETEKYGVLKSMMVHQDYRGTSVARTLLGTVVAEAKARELDCLYLGTMEQFKAAQRFYAKSGFASIAETELPKDFPGNPLDTVFFRMTL